jgi:hypothetical protein
VGAPAAVAAGAPAAVAVVDVEAGGMNMMSKKMRMNLNGLLTGILAGMALLAPLPVAAQQAFPTADAAAAALVEAISQKDEAAKRRVLGDDWRAFIPTENIEDKDRDAFLKGWAESHKIVVKPAHTAHLAVGAQDWVLPIPIVEKKGAWRFDTRAAVDEIRTRRIGANELATMQAALAYYDAQKEYAREDRNGDGVLEYAQQLISTPGKQDGLYWAALEGEKPSPLGPLFGEAGPSSQGYHGYRFRILTAQGSKAPGGAYDYLIGGRLVGGFALVAWPVKYGDSGIMSFIVSHNGVLYQKNLGPKTDATARAMKLFNPDSSWKKVNP